MILGGSLCFMDIESVALADDPSAFTNRAGHGPSILRRPRHQGSGQQIYTYADLSMV